MKVQSEMTFEEMAQLVDAAREVEFGYWQIEHQRWCVEQREKAPKILAMLREHLPAGSWHEVESFLSSRFGCECLYETLEREQRRAAFLLERPTANEEEIENYLVTGCFTSSEELQRNRRELFDDLPF